MKPSQEQMDEVMMPLYNYLNQNLEVLAQYLTQEMLKKVMVAVERGGFWAQMSFLPKSIVPKLSVVYHWV